MVNSVHALAFDVDFGHGYFPAFFFAAFFRFAHDFAIAIDILLLNSASSGGAMASAIIALAVFFFGAVVSRRFAAQRARVASPIRLRAAADMVRFFFAGFALGSTQSGTLSGSGAGVPCKAVIAAWMRSRSSIKSATMCDVDMAAFYTTNAPKRIHLDR